MEPALLMAMTTFAAGVLLLLGWSYLTTDNPHSSKLLAKSLWLFVAPGIVIWALPDRLMVFPLSMWALVFVEECLKGVASRTQRTPIDRFSLVALFGIWELMLAKSVWALTGGQIPSDWGRPEIIGLVLATAAPVLMHLVTAAIYAFHFTGRLWAALLTSWLIHVAFNEAADLLGISPLATGAKIILLAILLVAIWPKAQLAGATNDNKS